MKKLILPFIALALIYSCGQEATIDGKLRKLKGGKYSGGVLRMNEVEDFRNLYPLEITEEASLHIGNQIYEGLVKFSQADLSVTSVLNTSHASSLSPVPPKTTSSCRCFISCSSIRW